MNTPWLVGLLVAAALACVSAGAAQDPKPAAPLPTAEAAVRELYSLVTFKAETQPDWDRVRSLFRKDAVVVLRTSRTATTAFSLDGFVQDFVTFAERPAVKAAGFQERVVRLKATEYGEIAQVLVLYEALVIGETRPPTVGIDSFHLVREDGRWQIVSIVNELVSPNRPLPPELSGGGEEIDRP